MSVRLNANYLSSFVSAEELTNIQPQVTLAHDLLTSREGAGNDFLGWTTLPVDYDKEEFARIKAAAEKIKNSCDIFIAIGIGGSYLGARAVIEFIKSNNGASNSIALNSSMSTGDRTSVPLTKPFSLFSSCSISSLCSIISFANTVRTNLFLSFS